MKPIAALIGTLFAYLLPGPASAQAPHLISYQGRLLNGTNLANGTVGLSLRLFNVPGGGSALYEDSNSVAVADGLYSTFIGDNPAGDAFLAALTNEQVWIEAAVNGAALSPRERMASAGYALSLRGLHATTNGSFVFNPGENSVHPGANHSSVGGSANTIEAGAYESFLGGGFVNTIGRGAYDSFLGGGYLNGIQEGSYESFLGGGFINNIESNAHDSVLGGGSLNTIQQGAYESFLGGGYLNVIQAEANDAVLGGGDLNSIEEHSHESFLGGGNLNSIGPYAPHSVIPGGKNNQVGSAATNAFAAGYRAKANHAGAFVWADKVDADFASATNNDFSVRAVGGVRFVSGIDGVGGVTSGVYLATGSGAWTSLSDRHAKEHFTPVDGRAILEKVSALPLSFWNYRTQDEGIRHIGPTAQDFSAAFGVGESDTGITTVDADGVALAAIQALAAADRDQRSEAREQKAEIRRIQQELDKQMAAKDARIEAQEKMILELRARLEALEKK